MTQEAYKSRVYTDRPAYADYSAPEKFLAIQSIIAKRLIEHPKSICSYSGGADSDILIDLIERTRELFNLPPIRYVFFNTGLEMRATKDHVQETARKYGVQIDTIRPKINIVQASRQYGIPFVSKIMSAGLSEFPDNTFHLVVFDPPHLIKAKETSWMVKKYGKLDASWPQMLHDGFAECMRVLKQDGVLIFKWSECDIPADKVWRAIGQKPLFGHHSGKKMGTFWACFMKGADDHG